MEKLLNTPVLCSLLSIEKPYRKFNQYDSLCRESEIKLVNSVVPNIYNI